MNLASFFTHHPLWGLLTLTVIVWYSTVTIYVGIRGVLDIKQMLANLKRNHTVAKDARNQAAGPK